MKTKFILTAFIGMLSLAGIANAQHVKVFSGQDTVVLSPNFPEGVVVRKTLTLDVPAERQNGRPYTYLTYKLARAVPPTLVNETYGIEILPGTSRSDFDTVVISYTGLESPDIRFFEAVIPASSREECLASTDFSGALLVGLDRARLTYDYDTSTNTVGWNILKNSPFQGATSCRVLLAVAPGGTVDAADLAVWQATYGTTGQ